MNIKHFLFTITFFGCLNNSADTTDLKATDARVTALLTAKKPTLRKTAIDLIDKTIHLYEIIKTLENTIEDRSYKKGILRGVLIGGIVVGILGVPAGYAWGNASRRGR